ncbi:MAG: hypothetical protein R6V77_04020, partial [Candidatus Cloacimonadaceae bacterium]
SLTTLWGHPEPVEGQLFFRRKAQSGLVGQIFICPYRVSFWSDKYLTYIIVIPAQAGIFWSDK